MRGLQAEERAGIHEERTTGSLGGRHRVGRCTYTPVGYVAWPGYSDTKEDVQKRLRRIEGQVRGLQRMVDEDVYCIDVLTQVSATTRALQSMAVELLDAHLRHCVADATRSDDAAEAERLVTEASRAIERLVRS